MTQVFLFVVIYTMEDKCITIDCDFVDSETGEVFAKSHRTVPQSQFTEVYVVRLYESFMRGVHLQKHIALNISVYLDRDLPKQLNLFDVY